MNVRLKLGADLPNGTMRGAPPSDGKNFFGLHLYLAGRCCEILQVPGAWCNINLAQASRLVCVTNIWLVGVTIDRTISQ